MVVLAGQLLAVAVLAQDLTLRTHAVDPHLLCGGTRVAGTLALTLTGVATEALGGGPGSETAAGHGVILLFENDFGLDQLPNTLPGLGLRNDPKAVLRERDFVFTTAKPSTKDLGI